MAKTISLYLYEDIQPNYNNTYYLTNSTQDIKTHLTSYLSATVTADNYRVNSNVIKIKNAGTNLYSNITYAIEEIIEEGSLIYWRCYHVKSIDYQSSYTILYCEVDIWGTYFHNAKLNNINVNRCNRNIGVGLLDDIKITDALTYTAVGDATITNANAMLVFGLNYNAYSTWYGTTSNIQLFAIDLDTIKKAFEATGIPNYYTATYYNAVQLASIFVNGIVKAGINNANYENARVLTAYVVPKEVLLTAEMTKMYVETSTIFGGGGVNNIKFAVLDVVPYEYTKAVTISNSFNNKYYIGTKYDNLEITRTTQSSINAYYKFISGDGKLTVTIQQGDNTKDITNSFEINIIQQETAHNVNVLSNIVSKGFGALSTILGLTTANPISAVAGASALAGGIGSDLIANGNRSVGRVAKIGDALQCYYRIPNLTDTPINNPLYICSYASLEDEEANARIFGAKFSEPISNIYNVFSSALLGTGSLASTYIKATCNVDEVPTDACDFIQNVLNSGAYFIDIRPNDNN